MILDDTDKKRDDDYCGLIDLVEKIIDNDKNGMTIKMIAYADLKEFRESYLGLNKPLIKRMDDLMEKYKTYGE